MRPQIPPEKRGPRRRPARPALGAINLNVAPPPVPAEIWTDGFQNPNYAIDRQDVLFIEYLARGDLFNFIIKIDRDGVQVPSRVLWNIWHCFLQMLIAMRYPTMPRRTGNHPTYREPEEGPVEYEEWLVRAFNPARYPRISVMNNVHFDIDPKNILIGDFLYAGVQNYQAPPPAGHPAPPPQPDIHKDPHHYVPCLKLADFGVMHEWDINCDDPKFVQQQRRQGKDDYRTPEQFTQEWETVDQLPGRKPRGTTLPPSLTNPQLATGAPDDATPVDTAGLYTWKNNLYQLALSMYSIITKRMPPKGPVATNISITIHPQAPPPNPFNPAPIRPPPYTKTARTYGGYLLKDRDFPHIDRRLREIIAQCMCEKPLDRPSWEELMHEARDKMDYFSALDEHDANPANAPGSFPLYAATAVSERNNGGLGDARRWCEDHFGNPTPQKLRDAGIMAAWYANVVANAGRVSGFTFPGPGAGPPPDLENVGWLP